MSHSAYDPFFVPKAGLFELLVLAMIYGLMCMFACNKDAIVQASVCCKK